MKTSCKIPKKPQGYSLIEMLTVTALILIISTVPVALLRRSREKVHEAEALSALRMMALAYENYWAQEGHRYPNYRSDGMITKDITHTNAEAIWDDLIKLRLIPAHYSGYPHNRRDLLARGYVLSIFPADYGAVPGVGPANTYAIGMIPYKGSTAKRGLAIIQGPRFFSNYPTYLPRKLKGANLLNTEIYTLPE